MEERFEHGFDAGVVDELAAGGASGLHEDDEREGFGGGGLEGDLLRDGVVGEGEVVGGEGVDDFFGRGLDEGGDDYEGGSGAEGGVWILREGGCGDGEEQSGLEEDAHAVGILSGGDDLWHRRLICSTPLPPGVVLKS